MPQPRVLRCVSQPWVLPAIASLCAAVFLTTQFTNGRWNHQHVYLSSAQTGTATQKEGLAGVPLNAFSLTPTGSPSHISVPQPTMIAVIHNIPQILDMSSHSPASSPAYQSPSVSSPSAMSPTSMKWNIPKGMPTPDPAYLRDPATPPSLIKPEQGSTTGLAWNIPYGQPTPDPAKLHDPATPPSLLKPGQGSPTSLAWNIPYGAPTPDPAYLHDPATPPALLKPGNGAPTGLAWNIPYGQPTPDPAKLHDPATPPSMLKGGASAPAGMQISWGTGTNGLDLKPPTPAAKPTATAPTGLGWDIPSTNTTNATKAPTPATSPTGLAWNLGTPSYLAPYHHNATANHSGANTSLGWNLPMGPTTQAPTTSRDKHSLPPVVKTVGAGGGELARTPLTLTPVAPPRPQVIVVTSPPAAKPEIIFVSAPPVKQEPVVIVITQPPTPKQVIVTPPPFTPQVIVITSPPVAPVKPEIIVVTSPPGTPATPQVVVTPPAPGPPAPPSQANSGSSSSSNSQSSSGSGGANPGSSTSTTTTTNNYNSGQGGSNGYSGSTFNNGPGGAGWGSTGGTNIGTVSNPGTGTGTVGGAPWWAYNGNGNQPTSGIGGYSNNGLYGWAYQNNNGTFQFDHNQQFLENYCDPRICTLNDNAKFHSMSNEDECVYEIFYTNPIKCCRVIVEIGAGDGDRFSVSKFFEDGLHWKTMAIEANPDLYQQLVHNRPNASTELGAFCESGSLQFDQGTFHAPSTDVTSEETTLPIPGSKTAQTIPCLEMAPVFSSRGIDHVDIMVLRVQGDALAFIRAMDWTVRVDIWVVLFHGGIHADRDKLVRKVLINNEYVQAEWDIKRWCSDTGKCLNNEVYLRKGFDPLPTVLQRQLVDLAGRHRHHVS